MPRKPRRDVFDILFMTVLLAFLLSMVGLFLYSATSPTLEQKLAGGGISVTGIIGAFYTYMRWRIIELVLTTGQHDPKSVTGDFMRRALALIPSSGTVGAKGAKGGNGG